MTTYAKVDACAPQHATIKQQAAIIQQLRKENTELKHQLDTVTKLMANPSLKPEFKLPWLALKWDEEHPWKDQDEEAIMGRLAHRVGMNKKTLGQKYIAMKAEGLIERDEVPNTKLVYDDAGLLVGRTHGTKVTLKTIPSIPPDELFMEDRQHGGRPDRRCPNCGSKRLKPASYVCQDCGVEHRASKSVIAGEDIPDLQEEEIEPVAQAFPPAPQAPAEQIEPSVTDIQGGNLHDGLPSTVHHNTPLKSDVKGEPQVPSNTATDGKNANFAYLGIPQTPSGGAAPKNPKLFVAPPSIDRSIDMTSEIPKSTVVPHCKHMNCLLGSNRTQPRFNGVYYCPIHRGFIDERGQPL